MPLLRNVFKARPSRWSHRRASITLMVLVVPPESFDLLDLPVDPGLLVRWSAF